MAEKWSSYCIGFTAGPLCNRNLYINIFWWFYWVTIYSITFKLFHSFWCSVNVLASFDTTLNCKRHSQHQEIISNEKSGYSRLGTCQLVFIMSAIRWRRIVQYIGSVSDVSKASRDSSISVRLRTRMKNDEMQGERKIASPQGICQQAGTCGPSDHDR